LRTLAGRSDGWKNHPVVKAWRGHEPVLLQYAYFANQEWIVRRHDSHGAWVNLDNDDVVLDEWITADPKAPPWYTEKLAERYRQHLLSKDEEYYRKRGFNEEPRQIESTEWSELFQL